MNMNISVFSLLVSGLFALEPAGADAKPARAEQPEIAYRGGGNYWNPYPGEAQVTLTVVVRVILTIPLLDVEAKS
ncbi:hypothetical protein DSO57_1037782 [Entomophthora muscae]|uniref:Uncharacterized protein n=1 Tax=Entomophthora muscae TaxID=34485 RepID=A0ACC2RDM3_9FUNG|nr:hypothetical protein DSO57_1037782 [Entomophthora muscae]